MKALSILAMIAGAVVVGCGASHPPAAADEIDRARLAYFRAQAGPAPVVLPDAMKDAARALEDAERAWREHPDDPATRDLAYIAAREAELAESRAGLLLAKRRKDEAIKVLEAQKEDAP